MQKPDVKKDCAYVSNGTITEYKFVRGEGRYARKRVKTLFDLLTLDLELDPDLTMNGLFDALAKYPQEMDLIFRTHLGKWPFQYFLDDIRSKEKIDAESDPILLCELGWSTEMYTKPNNLDVYTAFGGYSTAKPNSKFYFGIEFLPLYQYKNAKLFLNKDIEIVRVERTKGKVEIHPVLKSKKDFSFFEGIGGIMYEISWHGSPRERQTIREMHSDLIHEVNEQLTKDDAKRATKK